MNTTTLRGVFPEPKPVSKRNFIKENVKHIKHMQGLLQNSETKGEDRFRNKPNRTPSQFNSLEKSGHTLQNSQSLSRSSQGLKIMQVPKRKIEFEKGKGDARNRQGVSPPRCAEKHNHRGVQTERAEDMKKLYDTGIIKYPSPALVRAMAVRSSAKKKEEGKTVQDRGDGVVVTNPHNKSLTENMQNLDLNEESHDYIKENIMAIKQRSSRHESSRENAERLHQRGSLPKYLKDRKEKTEVHVDADCPEGHVLLPEEERKETLKVLRQSYADRIQELNSMPVRNDTLRMRNRKIAIEEELKKIDEGIKVFQRPKVFVKINA